ncbi:hypothetical protein EYF80_037728 [Liparis tanakae]|uniref:Uncharacterized protein n=1 Tax=Liparis tanakae TaxID=230148 RepID=A0A4Z2GET7_9TELE|nr:hypothetical protein EYF80_037728 [Liparis tanakae]
MVMNPDRLVSMELGTRLAQAAAAAPREPRLRDVSIPGDHEVILRAASCIIIIIVVVVVVVVLLLLLVVICLQVNSLSWQLLVDYGLGVGLGHH